MLGREISIAADLLGVRQANTPYQEPPEYVRTLLSRMRSAHLLARGTLEQEQKIQKAYYDLKLRKSSYEKGDLVYKLDSSSKPGQSKKLNAIYKGPYLIVEVLSPVLYRIEDRKKASVIHHDRLKVCNDRAVPLWIRRRRHQFLELEESLKLDDKDSEASSEDLATSSIPDQPKLDDIDPEASSDDLATYSIPDQPESSEILPSTSKAAPSDKDQLVICHPELRAARKDEDSDTMTPELNIDEGDLPALFEEPVVSRSGRRIRVPTHLRDFVLN